MVGEAVGVEEVLGGFLPASAAVQVRDDENGHEAGWGLPAKMESACAKTCRSGHRNNYSVSDTICRCAKSPLRLLGLTYYRPSIAYVSSWNVKSGIIPAPNAAEARASERGEFQRLPHPGAGKPGGQDALGLPGRIA